MVAAMSLFVVARYGIINSQMNVYCGTPLPVMRCVAGFSLGLSLTPSISFTIRCCIAFSRSCAGQWPTCRQFSPKELRCCDPARRADRGIDLASPCGASGAARFACLWRSSQTA
jgi:hypothetical protein